DLHALRFALETADPALALAAADRADGACPGLAWQTALTRALKAESPAKARAVLRPAIGAAAARRTGPYKLGLKIMVVDDHDLVNANIELQAAGLAVGGGAGTFQLGAGSSTKPSEKTGVTLTLGGDGGPHGFAVEALILEAWIALAEGDDRAADETLAGLTDLLWYGTDPGLLAEPPAASAAGGAAQVPIRVPLALSWLVALAEARGHAVPANRIRQALRAIPGELPQGPYGTLSVCCDEAEDEGDKPHSALVRCAVPRLLALRVPDKAQAPFARWLHLQTRQADGLPVKPRDLQRARAALEKAWRAFPGQLSAEARLMQQALAGEGDAAAALKGPYRCGAVGALLQGNRVTVDEARPVAYACGPTAVRFMTLDRLPADFSPAALAGTAQLIARMGRLYGQARAPLWQAVFRWVRQADSDLARVARARTLAQTAAEVGDLDAAFDLEALALAAKVVSGQPADPAPLVADAVGANRGLQSSRRFVKALHFKPATARAEAARLLGLKAR
ncbi:MAG: hypothetical protein KC613_27390, partial [Myxococcales bacterium]|nr:hypothetical protein [Myxococcales bacterium]